MAPPVVAATLFGAQPSNVSTQTVTLPSGVTPGDLLVLIFGCDGAPQNLAAAGYTKLGVATGCSVFWRRATGSDACTVTSMDNEKAAWVIYRISGGGDPTGSSATGDSAAPNPPLHRAETVSDHLWVCGYCQDGGEPVAGFPSGYTGTAANGDGGTSATTAAAWKPTTATSSEDPDSFSSEDDDAWGAWTLAVPGVAAEPTANTGAFFAFF